MNTLTRQYNCHNRPPFTQDYKATGGTEPIATFGKLKCQFTRTDLGKVDPACVLCGWKPGGRLDVLETRE